MGRRVAVDYGRSKMEVTVPDDAMIVEPSSLPPLPDGGVAALKEVLENPMNMDRIPDLVRKGSRVLIAFDDVVKVGSFRRLFLPIVLDELHKAGVSDKDITLVCAVGWHRKNTVKEMSALIGRDVAESFLPDRLRNHDADDRDNLVNLGTDNLGNVLEVNKLVADSDLTIYIGCVRPITSFGGYTGASKGVAVGLAGTKGIFPHHCDDQFFEPGPREMIVCDPWEARARRLWDSFNDSLEERTGKPIFYINSVMNYNVETMRVFAGRANAIREPSWKVADEQWVVTVPKEADVFVFGVPEWFHYGDTDNPIAHTYVCALFSRAWRGRPVLREGGVIIAASMCDGSVNEDWWGSSPNEMVRLLRKAGSVEEITYYRDDFENREEWIYQYRYRYAYHPMHCYSITSKLGFLFEHTSNVFVVGSRNPGAIRDVHCTPVKTFEDAWKKTKQIVGGDPSVVVIPTLRRPIPVLKVA